MMPLDFCCLRRLRSCSEPKREQQQNAKDRDRGEFRTRRLFTMEITHSNATVFCRKVRTPYRFAVDVFSSGRSVIEIERITSPRLMLSTTSMPATTLPNTV